MDEWILSEMSEFLRYHHPKHYSSAGSVSSTLARIRHVVNQFNLSNLEDLNKDLDRYIASTSGSYRTALHRYKEFLDYQSTLPIEESHEIDRDLLDGRFKGVYDPNLEAILREKILPDGDILALAEAMTKKNIASRVLESDLWIMFSGRKKRLSDWLKPVCEFIQFYCQRDSVTRNEYRRFRNLVHDCLTEDNDRIQYPYCNECLERILLLIIGVYWNIDPTATDQAEEYLHQLRGERRPPLFYALLGEYLDSICLPDLQDGDRRVRMIKLYLSNIKDRADRNNRKPQDDAIIVFAHESFHYFHYLLLPYPFSDFFDYDPGSIVKESFASYFEYHYAIFSNAPYSYTDSLEDSWYKNSPLYYPYAGAKHLHEHGGFAQLFDDSFRDLVKVATLLKQ